MNRIKTVKVSYERMFITTFFKRDGNSKHGINEYYVTDKIYNDRKGF